MAKTSQTSKRNRPADVEASKSINSPPRKKNKPGTHMQLSSTIQTDDKETTAAALAPSCSRPQLHSRRAQPAATSTTHKNAQASEDSEASGTSASSDNNILVENANHQRLADALADEDARAAGAEQVQKERAAMAHSLFADQNWKVDSSGEDDDYEDAPVMKCSEESKVWVPCLLQEFLLTCIATAQQTKTKLPPKAKRGSALRDLVDRMVVEKKGKGADKGTAHADKERARYVIYISQQFQCNDTNCQERNQVMSPLLQVSKPTLKIESGTHKRFLKPISVLFMMRRP
jgi:hypothetical protein